MNNSSLLISDMIIFFIIMTLTLSCLYAAWMNYTKKKISAGGFDALILVFFDVFNKENATAIRENPQLIRRMGMVTLIIGISSLNALVELFIKDIWPHLR